VKPVGGRLVTRRRLHIETMERLFAGKDKIIIDADASGSGVGCYPA
jgi:membrane protease subunit HflK